MDTCFSTLMERISSRPREKRRLIGMIVGVHDVYAKIMSVQK